MSFKILSLYFCEWYKLLVYSAISSLPNNIFSSIALFKYPNTPRVTFLLHQCVSYVVYVMRYIRLFLHRNHRDLSRRRIERMQTREKYLNSVYKTDRALKVFVIVWRARQFSSCFTKYLSIVEICSRVIFQTFKTIRLSDRDLCHVIVDSCLLVDAGKARINFHNNKSRANNLTV